jgi:hypothetical protein
MGAPHGPARCPGLWSDRAFPDSEAAAGASEGTPDPAARCSPRSESASGRPTWAPKRAWWRRRRQRAEARCVDQRPTFGQRRGETGDEASPAPVPSTLLTDQCARRCCSFTGHHPVAGIARLNHASLSAESPRRSFVGATRGASFPAGSPSARRRVNEPTREVCASRSREGLHGSSKAHVTCAAWPILAEILGSIVSFRRVTKLFALKRAGYPLAPRR